MAKPIDDLTPKARRTRASLVAAARSIIGKNGVAGLNVMDVCDAAGVGRTSFYNYFDGANSLVETVASSAAEEVRKNFNAQHEDVPRGLKRLERCLDMILRIATDDPETALLLTSLADNSPAIPKLLREEILNELEGAGLGGRGDQPHISIDALATHLAVSELGICRKIALGEIAKDQIAAHVGFMLKACQSPIAAEQSSYPLGL